MPPMSFEESQRYFASLDSGADPEIIPPDWTKPAGQGASDEEPGALGHVLHLLSYIDRPRNALATATKYGLSPDLDKTALSGLAKGFMGDEDTSWGDIVGIPAGTPQDDWGTWLAKGGSRLLLDALGDPTLALGKVSKAAKGLQAYQKASEAMYGGAIGRTLLHGVPAHRAAEFSEPLSAAMRAKNERFMPKMDEFGRLIGEEKAALEKAGMTSQEARAAFERGDALPPDIFNIYGKYSGWDAETLGQLNKLRETAGIEPIKELTDINYVPRVLTAQGRRDVASEVGAKGAGAGSSLDASRELMLVTDPLGNPIMRGGKPVVSTSSHPLSGLEKEGDKWFLKAATGAPRIPVELTQASLDDILKSGAVSGDRFIPGTAESFMSHIGKMENERAFLDFFTKNIKPLGDIRAGQPGWLTKVETMADLRTLPKNWRPLDIPGLENYAAPKWAATALEKKSSLLWDPATPMGAIEQFGQKAMDTKLGSLLGEGTSWWKRNVLGLHLGYYSGNIASNIPQMYLSGQVPAYMIPTRIAQAVKVAMGKGEPVLEGMPNAQLAKELMTRDVFTATWAGQEAGDALQQAVQGAGRTRRTAEALPDALQPVGKAIATGAEAYGKLNTAALRNVGGQTEANARIGVIIDYLKRNGVDFTKLSPEESASWLDKAAEFGKTALINYSEGTPLEKLAQRSVFPFLPWTRGITANTLKVLQEHPERLGRFSRGLDTAFMPMDKSDQDIMDPWQKEQSPTRGVAGTTYDQIYQKLGNALPFLPPEWFDRRSEGDRMALIGRYLPHGNIEQLAARPADMVQAMVNPLLKAPMELGYSNKSSFTERDIDTVSGGFPGSLFNPLLGRPYQLATRKTLGATLPAAWQYLLEQSPAGRTVGAASEIARGMGAFEDPYRAETSPFEAMTWYTSGGKVYPFDASKSIMRRQTEAKKKQADIKSKLNYAAAKGDIKGVEHYLQYLLPEAEMDPLRGSGMTE